MFPPPKFLAMPHIGLDVSDDAVHFLEFGSRFGHNYIKQFKSADLPDGLIIGSDITDQDKLVAILAGITDNKFTGDKKPVKSKKPIYAKVSIPEEKAYLFQTDVPSSSLNSIYQNIESKLEENVPLSAKDALFHFEIIDPIFSDASLAPRGSLRASVSVVPRTYIDHLSTILKSANIVPISFETVPTALARAIIPKNSRETIMIVHLMKHKMGIYIVSFGVVCFTSTLIKNSSPDALIHEINHVSEYWNTKIGTKSIDRVILVGHEVIAYEKEFGVSPQGLSIPISIPNVWSNACDINGYVSPIERVESLNYAVASGLAMSL